MPHFRFGILLALPILLSGLTMAGGEKGAEADYLGGTVGGIRPGSEGRAWTTDPEAFVYETKGRDG